MTRRGWGALFWRTTRERLPWWSRHLLGVGSVLVLLAGFLRLTQEVFADTRLDAFDRAVMQWVVVHRSPALTQGAIDLTALGSPTLFWLFTGCALSMLVAVRDLRGALQLLLAALGSTFVVDALKGFLARPRPAALPLVVAHGFSYPSGHTVSAAALYVTLALVGARHFKDPAFGRRLVALAIVATVLVACSRVYLGVHYPTDVASGSALGAGWALLLASAFAYGEERARRRRHAAEPAG